MLQSKAKLTVPFLCCCFWIIIFSVFLSFFFHLVAYTHTRIGEEEGCADIPLQNQYQLVKEEYIWRGTGNIVIEQEFGNSSSSGLELAYAGQVRYRVTPNIQPGFEVFGKFGEFDDMAVGNEQHKIGPGVFGFVELDENIGIKYEFSWLFGYTEATPENSLKWLFEFEYKY